MVSLLIVGAGSRGATFAGWARRHPEAARVVAVAEPRAAYRDRLGDEYGIPPERRFRDWREAAERGPVADAAVIATLDRQHAGPALALAAQGYALLIEKPLAPTEEECERIAAAVDRAGILAAVAHVLRYTPYTRRLKQLLDAGAIGEIVSIDHLEPVGFWHQAHSYVRGNWRREDETGPMLLAKCCHDLDWLSFLVDDRCVWDCDNDVVDHQVVGLQYERGATASLTMTAFTRMRERETRIFGTRGELTGDGQTIAVYDFRTQRTTRHDVDPGASGHGGGDDGVMAAFVAAVAAGDPALVPTAPAETLASHRIAFAAEAACREQRVVALAPALSATERGG
jgi:predicted dehydrogenase